MTTPDGNVQSLWKEARQLVLEIVCAVGGEPYPTILPEEAEAWVQTGAGDVPETANVNRAAAVAYARLVRDAESLEALRAQCDQLKAENDKYAKRDADE